MEPIQQAPPSQQAVDSNPNTSGKLEGRNVTHCLKGNCTQSIKAVLGLTAMLLIVLPVLPSITSEIRPAVAWGMTLSAIPCVLILMIITDCQIRLSRKSLPEGV